jgi:hypothetical protein
MNDLYAFPFLIVLLGEERLSSCLTVSLDEFGGFDKFSVNIFKSLIMVAGCRFAGKGEQAPLFRFLDICSKCGATER